MDFKAVGSIISKFAPMLGSAISVGNPLAGLLISLVGQVFGFDSKPLDTQSIIDKITGDQSAEIKLKQIEADHSAALYATEVDDRKDAREREEAIVKATGKRDFILESIAFIVIFGYFVMCGLIAFNKIDNESNQVLYMMFGQLTGGFIMVLSYYFGSSKTEGDSQ